MHRRNLLTASVAMPLALMVPSSGFSQPGTLKDQLVGSWTLVSTRTTRPDGSIYGPYGPNEKGTLIFDRSGRFALILVNPDVPKFQSNNRERPTAEEALAAMKGSFAFFGSYSVSEPDRTFLFHIEASSFPNFNGTNQKRIVKSITANELVFVNDTPPNAGARAELTYRRVL
jgi:hypothetical protein